MYKGCSSLKFQLKGLCGRCTDNDVSVTAFKLVPLVPKMMHWVVVLHQPGHFTCFTRGCEFTYATAA